MKTSSEVRAAAQQAFDDLHSIYGTKEYEAMFALISALADSYHMQMLTAEADELQRYRSITCSFIKLQAALADRTGKTAFLL